MGNEVSQLVADQCWNAPTRPVVFFANGFVLPTLPLEMVQSLCNFAAGVCKLHVLGVSALSWIHTEGFAAGKSI